MRWKYLRVGDVIFLQKGTTVAYPDQPVTIANHSISAFSKMRGDIWVRIGIEQSNRTDVSQEKTILRERISAAFSDLEISLDESIMDRFIAHQVKDTAPQQIFLPAANYLVVETTFARGICHIWCQELYATDPPKIYFWQGEGERLSALVHNDIEVVHTMF